jgi:hypothetical protein
LAASADITTVDDLKYESKYKELKKKVKEVEEVRRMSTPPSAR